MGALVTVLALAVPAVAALWWWVTTPSDVPAAAAVDEQAMALVEERLAPVLKDFDAVTLPASSAAGTEAATVEGCFIDSGQTHEPSAVRVWDLPSTATGEQALDATSASRQAALSIAEQLRDLGWAGGQRLTPADWTELTLTRDGYGVTATINAFGDAVYLTAETSPSQVCS
ncbi:hypothetical protein [uncultured Pseudokineococcus sp.]|uniref:hypothetical protein n=1 Tax=uncultured Pseudokineococcus sp. TaxID=1642928 RepID=UPI0026299D5F|nr:hypothetical protein [uncultured Pseudokineococcus sp.]